MAGELSQVLAAAQASGSPFDAAVIMAGTNDIGGLGVESEPESIAGSIAQLHQICHEHGVAPTLAVGIPESRSASGPNGPFQTKRLEANRRLQDWALGVELGGGGAPTGIGELVHYVECPVRYDPTGASRHHEADGLHMTKAGYAALGRGLSASVAALLGSRGS